MKTSQQWWDETKADPAKINNWLIRQYRGEVTAAMRINALVESFTEPHDTRRGLLAAIATEESRHASWILWLLSSRDIQVSYVVDVDAEKRYWAETLSSIESFETGAAIGAHAEKMRLERIKVIAADESAPDDIRRVFKLILKDELKHEETFRMLAGDQAMTATRGAADRGRQVLGLEA